MSIAGSHTKQQVLFAQRLILKKGVIRNKLKEGNKPANVKNTIFKNYVLFVQLLYK